MADDSFSPSARHSFGARMRFDIVLNNLAGLLGRLKKLR